MSAVWGVVTRIERMAKAQIRTPEGLTIKVDGTPKEIAEVVQDLKKAQRRSGGSTGSSTAAGSGKLPDLIASLIDGGFFKTPKDLAAIKLALEEMGHHYPVTTLSPTMLRQVRKRRMRRLKKADRWVYTA